MKIAIVGTGYVGLITGVSLALLDHTIVCIEQNKDKVSMINRGKSPFYEPGIDKLLRKVTKQGYLLAIDTFEGNINGSDISIIAVGTPTINNKIDLSAIKKAARQVGEALRKAKDYHVVVIKSTVVPGTTENIIKPILEKYSGKKFGEFGLCVNPEFLREGQALEETLHPARIVIGANDKKSKKVVSKMYKKMMSPKLITNIKTAEMTKYISNAFFATVISFSNEVARICEGMENMDVLDIWRGVHLDNRLNPVIGNKRVKPGILQYMLSGCGYGGSCLPKDTKALASFAEDLEIGTPILKKVIGVNESQPARMLSLLKSIVTNLSNKKIAVLGLSFKPNTDDIRESTSIVIINILLQEQANVFVHDPVVYKHGIPHELKGLKITFSKDIKEAIKNAYAALIVTAWEEYKKLTPELLKQYMKTPVVIDGRRILSKEKFIVGGVTYRGIGLS